MTGAEVIFKKDINKPNCEGYTKLHRAVKNCDSYECLKLLLAGANPNLLTSKSSYNWTPFMLAMICGLDDEEVNRERREIVIIMLEAGADVNLRNSYGITAFMIASQVGTTDIVELLIQAGADVNAIDNEDRIFPLWLACYRSPEQSDMVRLLIEAGADVNKKSSDGRTALMRAVVSRHPDIVRQLLEVGADVDIQDNDGSTALMDLMYEEESDDLAEEERRKDILLKLLEAGADIDVEDQNGNTALTFAGESGLWEAAYLMMKLSRSHLDKEYKKFIINSHNKKLKDAHEAGVLVCKWRHCGREFAERQDLINHIKTNHDEYEQGCEEYHCMWEVRRKLLSKLSLHVRFL